MEVATGPSHQAMELTAMVDEALRLGEAANISSPESVETTVEKLGVLFQWQVSTQLLLETQAGRRIRHLTKHADPRIVQSATNVVQTWKEIVKRENPDPPGSNGALAGTASGPFSASQPDLCGAALQDQDQRQPKRQKSGLADVNAPLTPGSAVPVAPTNASTAHASKPRPAAKHPIDFPKAGDVARDKTRALLAEALALALPDVPGGDPGAAAAEAEEAMFRFSCGVNVKYKAKYRSIAFNLKDAANPDLRRRVLSGEVSGETLMVMTAEEMASNARKEENSRIREAALFEAERGQHMKKATTDQFQCGKCKQRKTQYYQLQTRSADEPMTTFVTCVNCGHRWKFC